MNSRERALTTRFGRFLLDSHRRELLADGVPVPIGSRAFDVLTVLVEARGQLVTKDELASLVWPSRFIEDNCLQFHISALRKALAPDRDFIKTIPGRGYCFIADVSTQGGADVVTQGAGSPLSVRFPATTPDPVGQEATSTGWADLVAAVQLAVRVDASGIVETRPGAESQQRVPPEIGQTWIATPGQPSAREVAFPAFAAMLQLAEDGRATPNGVGAGPAPKRLFILLSLEPVVLGRQDYAARTPETLLA